MATTLIAVVIALALGHFAPALAAAVRKHTALATQMGTVANAGGRHWRGWLALMLFIALPVLPVAAVQLALSWRWLLPAALLFAVAVLFFCWGPRDLDLDVRAIRDAPDGDARKQAAAALWPHGQAHALDAGSLVEAVMRNALRRWFGVLFWFALLGAAGAVLYRMSMLAVESRAAQRLPEPTHAAARVWLGWIEWPVAQLMTLAMALVGSFDAVVRAWRGNGGMAFAPQHRFLGAAARASVRTEVEEEVADFADSGLSEPTALALAFGPLPELTDAMRLVWRMLALWLAVIAVFVIAGFVT